MSGRLSWGRAGFVLLLLALISGGCGSGDETAPTTSTARAPVVAAPPPIAFVGPTPLSLDDLDPRPIRRAPNPRQSCTFSTDSLEQLSSAIVAGKGGDVLCLEGDHGGSELIIRSSGSPGDPIVVQGSDATIGGITVEASDVVVNDFTVVSNGQARPGVRIGGADVVIEGLTVVDPSGDGISCGSNTSQCDRVVIANSSVSGADGSGIIIFGVDNRITGNEISGSVRIKAGDADGIRFFGRSHVISENLIHSIYDRGYEGEGPHTDCFQTFDNSKPPTVGVIIERNVCVDVDHQCLIASAEESAADGAIGRSGALTFRNNICANNGSQALLLREFPGSVVANNLFLDTVTFQGIVLQNFSTDVELSNNVFLGPHVPYSIDEGSEADADHNLHDQGNADSPVAAEPNGLWGIEPGFEFDGRWPLSPGMGSPLIDAGRESATLIDALDASGSIRVIDGDGDGAAVPDIGPFEHP